MTKLSKWLRGNLKDNVKETFEATIEHLLKLNPPEKVDLNLNKIFRINFLMSSLQALMKNDESVHEGYESLNAWVNVNNFEKEKEKNLKIVEQAMFKKARSAQTQNSNNIVSEHEVSTDIKEAQKINPLNGQKVKEEKEDDLSSRIPHKFSFSASKQGPYVEPILEHVEKALFRFVVKNRDYFLLTQ
ncbi:19716_t:CDS:2 [Dentiscutata erythropus]|uniref:19716_t:CDS:1 n=1 Tax=Dentiscutata erythropus TaxID=1348616 RepID=A0A9N8VQE2_9GLOM|nr:19716_t:CDS:2 [Dentiscutata erythropus]